MEQQGPATLSAVPRTSPGPRGRLLRGQVGTRRRRTTSPTIWLPRATRGKAGICPILAGAQNKELFPKGVARCAPKVRVSPGIQRPRADFSPP